MSSALLRPTQIRLKLSIWKLRRNVGTNRPVYTRFAPSPTGMLHIGGLRTALYNYLFAKKHGGQFILRIEDTDRARTLDGSLDNIKEMLAWASLNYDQGPDREGDLGPYIQSLRSEHYINASNALIESGHAYRCFCSEQRLRTLRTQQMNRGVRAHYDRHCLRLKPSEIQEKLDSKQDYVVRLKVPSGVTTVTDLLLGEITFKNTLIDDQILIKSDKSPTYHLSNVVDDHLMNITHVIRGDEWLASTPKHIMLYKGLEWNPPKFLHIPLLLNPDHSKLSKRRSHTSVMWYRDQGYLPEAVINFVSLMGWTPKSDVPSPEMKATPSLKNKYDLPRPDDAIEIDETNAITDGNRPTSKNPSYLASDREGENTSDPKHSPQTTLLTLEDMIESFSIEDLHKSPAIVNIGHLNWLNAMHIRRLAKLDPNKLYLQVLPYIRHLHPTKPPDPEKIKSILTKIVLRDARFDTIPLLVQRLAFVFVKQLSYPPLEEGFPKLLSVPVDLIELQIKSFETEFTQDGCKSLAEIKEILNKAILPKEEITKSIAFQLLRYVLTTRPEGIDLALIIDCLGTKEVVRRLSRFINNRDNWEYPRPL